MKDLPSDEIASVLLARMVREIEYFVQTTTIHEDASAEQVWSHFVDHLIRTKELEGQV